MIEVKVVRETVLDGGSNKVKAALSELSSYAQLFTISKMTHRIMR